MNDLTGLAALIKRAQVLASSAIAYLTAISAVLVVLAQQLESVGVLGVDVPEWLTRAIATAIAFVGVVILQVRRVTPVDDVDKGLLPPKGPAVPAGGGAGGAGPDAIRDVGAVNISTLLIALSLVCLIVFTIIAAEWVESTKGFVWLGGGLSLYVAASLAP